MTRDLLLEIGTEEIPARFLMPALKELAEKGRQRLQENRLSFGEVRTLGTPRRLALYITEVAEKQEDLVEEVRGPAVKVAYKEDGTPTGAALGFAKGQKVKVEDLVTKTTDAGEYVFALKKSTGQTAGEILSVLLPELIRELSFPKPMRWGNGEMRFIRPVHWVTALLGEEVLSVELAGLRAGRNTRGHRFLAPEEIVLKEPGEYEVRLEKAYVIADPQKRREMVYEQVTNLALSEGGRIEEHAPLLEEVTDLLEYPTALCGKFDSQFLELPEEVLVTCMREHQRYFHLRDEKGRLLPKFIAVRNGTADHLQTVKEGNEKVLRARMADAAFFYREDLAEPLESRVAKLDTIVFQEGLGSMGDKTCRLKKLAIYLGQSFGLPETVIIDAERAAYLAKADLVTEMVGEFPELQGIMGSYYAAHSGEKESVCAGIREHYLPRFTGDVLPSTPVGAVVALADKIDTIVGCFAHGIQPTGSQDPYALRRQALGIYRTLVSQERRLNLKELIATSYALYEREIKLTVGLSKVQAQLKEFFRQRLENILEEKGIRYDVTNAILEISWYDPADAYRRALALTKLCEEPELKDLLTAYNRAANLARKAESAEVDPALFESDAESRLWHIFQQLREYSRKKLLQEDYVGALKALSPLREPTDVFFNGVMVMVEDEPVRRNRLALLKQISSYVDQIAKLSELVV